MEITEHHSGEVLELRITGRLDSSWADPFARRLDEMIREGAHHLRLDLSEVAYLSSAGIRVLVKFYRQLQGIQGSFSVVNPSEPVKTVLDLAGLGTLLMTGTTAPAAAPATQAQANRLEGENATFEIFAYAPGASLTCQTIGGPDLLLGCRFSEEHCHNVLFPDTTFAVGLGAFGNSFADCRSRFGEFLAVAGAATRTEHQALAPLVRPLGKGPWPAGHFHAAAFSYRPLQKGALDVKTTVSTLFEAETLQGVLHLLNDDREIAGAGQSEFVRGACWISPITEVAAERGKASPTYRWASAWWCGAWRASSLVRRSSAHRP